MASVHRRVGSKYWIAAWRDLDGRQHQRSTKQTDHRTALNVAHEYERAWRLQSPSAEQIRNVLNDALTATGETALKPVSVREYFTAWESSAVARVADSTAHKYRTPINRFLRTLGPTAAHALDTITRQHVEAFVAGRRLEGVGWTTIGQNLKVLRAVFREAVRENRIRINPVDGVSTPKAQPVERGIFSPAEISLLIAAATAEWKTLLLLAYYTGARMNDCTRMLWTGERVHKGQTEGVDFTAQTLTYWSHKTSKLVTVPLHSHLFAHLDHLAGDQTGHLIPGLATKGPGGQHGLSQAFKELMHRAGVDSQPVNTGLARNQSRRTFHALRHSFNSALANAGVPQETRMAITGHESAEINSRYTHHDLAVMADAVSKLPALP